MTIQTFTETLVVIHCHKCHVPFGLEQSHYDRARASKDVSFFCTNGHEAIFKKSREQELEENLAMARRGRELTQNALTATRDQLEATERSLRGHKAAKTRIKNRIAAGVCPCCNRSFQNVARHMSGQHPDYAKEQGE